MPSKEPNVLKRSTTPRLRQFIEETVGRFSIKAEAAKNLKISLTELSFFTTGSRTPSPQRILNFAKVAGEDASASKDFCGNLDQRLMDGGYSPVFFKHIVPAEQGIMILKKTADGGYSIEATRSTEAMPAVFSDLRLAGRHAAFQVAQVRDEKQSAFVVLEPIHDDTELADGELALFAWDSALRFGWFRRTEEGVSFSGTDPFTMSTGATQAKDFDPLDSKFDLRARVLLQFKEPVNATFKHEARPRPPQIRALDKLRVGIAPFQDALLITVGTELGLFEEEGLLVETEPVDWYEWPGFFGPDPNAAIVFSNIFSFAREYADLPLLRFLYGVNLFDKGFALLAKPEDSREFAQYGGQAEGSTAAVQRILADRDEEFKIKIGTIAESDWAAQIFTLCEEKNLNLAVSYGPFEQHIFPKAGKMPRRPTIVIVDSNRQVGVVNDPAVINRTQSMYLGSMPQRIRLINDYGWYEVNELQIGKPWPVNGFVGMSNMLGEHKDILLRFLRVWFRIVNYIQPEIQDLIPRIDSDTQLGSRIADAQMGSRIVQRAFDSDMFAPHIAKLNISLAQGAYKNEIAEAWRKEKFPRTPFEVEQCILGDSIDNPWKNDARRAIKYLHALFQKDGPHPNKNWHTLEREINSAAPCSTNDAFALNFVQQEYVARYGRGAVVRANLKSEPMPELLNASSVSRNS